MKNLMFDLAAVGVIALLIGLPLWCVLHDPKLSADETAVALQKKLGTPYGFHCTPEENDGTVEGLDDVDYVCQAERDSESGYWVGTDDSKITGIQPTG